MPLVLSMLVMVPRGGASCRSAAGRIQAGAR
jgi:hypothetical protein